MLSFLVQFWQTDGQTDRKTPVTQYAPYPLMWVHEIELNAVDTI